MKGYSLPSSQLLRGGSGLFEDCVCDDDAYSGYGSEREAYGSPASTRRNCALRRIAFAPEPLQTYPQKPAGDLDAELTRKALEVFERALDQPDAARTAWLHAHHGGDPQLITEVKRMLDADAAAALAFPTEGPVLDQARRPPPERVGQYRIAGAAAAGVLVALAVSTLLYLRAEVERQAADRRYGEVRELATFMMFDLYNELGKVAGNTQALELIADRSLGYLESLRDDAMAPVAVKVEAAVGYRQLADVLGNPHGPNLGERATATGMLDEAVAVLEGLYVRNPDNRDVMLRLGEAAFSVATNASVSDNNNEKARELGLRATEVHGRLAARTDGTVDDRRNQQRARIVAAATLPWMGKAADGIVELQDLRANTAELLKEFPDNPDVEQFLGSINVELARATVRLRDATAEGGYFLAYWDEAVRVREKGWARNPQDTRTYRSLATILYERGAERRAVQQCDGALEDMKRAEAIALDLLGRDASDKGLKRRLGGIRDETAKTLAYAGRGAEAVAALPVALAQPEAEIAEAPENAGMAREYAYSLSLYADVYLTAGYKAEACAIGREAKAA